MELPGARRRVTWLPRPASWATAAAAALRSLGSRLARAQPPESTSAYSASRILLCATPGAALGARRYAPGCSP